MIYELMFLTNNVMKYYEIMKDQNYGSYVLS